MTTEITDHTLHVDTDGDNVAKNSEIRTCRRLPREVRRTHRAAGLTLLEVVIGLAIFAVGVLALSLCVPMASRRIMRSGSHTRASLLASETAEELLTVPYGDGKLTAGMHDDPANPHDGLYYVRWVVEDDQPLAHCKRIAVRVARHSASGAPEVQIVIVTPASGG